MTILFLANTQDYPLDYLEIEPLKLECQHFVNCCASGQKARSDGKTGLLLLECWKKLKEL